YDKENAQGDKVHMVDNGGLKIAAKLTKDDKRQEYQLNLEGKDLKLKLRMKPYLVKLAEGTKYTMTVDAGDETFDPLLVVLDEAGHILAYDDDSGGKLNSKLFFTPKNSGTFMIHVAGVGDTLGPYTLKIAESVTNVVRLGFPAGKCDSADLAKSDTAWEIEW